MNNKKRSYRKKNVSRKSRRNYRKSRSQLRKRKTNKSNRIVRKNRRTLRNKINNKRLYSRLKKGGAELQPKPRILKNFKAFKLPVGEEKESFLKGKKEHIFTITNDYSRRGKVFLYTCDENTPYKNENRKSCEAQSTGNRVGRKNYEIIKLNENESIDKFTKSNVWHGKEEENGVCLHHHQDNKLLISIKSEDGKHSFVIISDPDEHQGFGFNDNTKNELVKRINHTYSTVKSSQS